MCQAICQAGNKKKKFKVRALKPTGWGRQVNKSHNTLLRVARGLRNQGPASKLSAGSTELFPNSGWCWGWCWPAEEEGWAAHRTQLSAEAGSSEWQIPELQVCGLEDGSSDASKPVHIRQVLEAKGLILLFSLTQELSINFRVYQVAVPRPPAQTQTPAAPNLSAPGQLFLHPQVTSQVSTLLQALTQGGHSGFTKVTCSSSFLKWNSIV